MAIVRYLVDDIEAAVSFYVEVLGFSAGERMGPFQSVQHSDLDLWLSGPGTSAAKPMPDGRRPEPGGWNRLVITVDDLDAVVAAARVAGATFRNDILVGPGGRQVLVDDPAGNPIELFEPRR